MNPQVSPARTWLRVLLGVYLLAVAAVTLTPGSTHDGTLGLVRTIVERLTALGLPVTFLGLEAVANVLMFVPFGVLVGLLLDRPRWAVVLLAAATSATIETVQRWVPARFPTLQDLVLNTLGAALGVVALEVVLRVRVRRASAVQVTRDRKGFRRGGSV